MLGAAEPQISDLGDEILGEEQATPQSWGHGASAYGLGNLSGWQAAGAAPARLPVQHPSPNDFFLRAAGELQTGCQIVISSWRGDHY